MGLVIMAGSGGVLPNLPRRGLLHSASKPDKARELLGRTHAARLMAGYRGSAALERGSRGRRAGRAWGGWRAILRVMWNRSMSNPFVALLKGGCAIDALIVLRKQ